MDLRERRGASRPWTGYMGRPAEVQLAVQVHTTALVVGPKARPAVTKLVELLTELWEEELVSHKAVLSVGPVTTNNPVLGANKPGAGREVRWTGTDLGGLLGALKANYADNDVAIHFEKVDIDAFEPAEEEEYEDVEDEGDDDGEDDEPVARAAAPAKAVGGDDGLGEFDMVPPSLVLYSLRAPREVEETNTSSKAMKSPKKFGARAAWITLDGEDVGYFVDDLDGSWLLDVVEDGFGPVKVGKSLR